MNSSKGAQDQDFRETLTPRFETPTPNEKKNHKAEVYKKLSKPPTTMKKYASIEKGFSNSEMLSHRIRYLRETVGPANSLA